MLTLFDPQTTLMHAAQTRNTLYHMRELLFYGQQHYLCPLSRAQWCHWAIFMTRFCGTMKATRR